MSFLSLILTICLYIFKTKFSTNKKKDYAKEKAIYNFLNTNLETNVKIPNIEYSYISD